MALEEHPEPEGASGLWDLAAEQCSLCVYLSLRPPALLCGSGMLKNEGEILYFG